MRSAPSEFQLRTQSELLLERHPQARLLAFFSPHGYQGAREILLKGRSFEVVEAKSSLHFHRLAARSENQGGCFVVLCPQREWLSQDLRERLPDRDLRDIDPWESIRKLFDAERIDSALQRRREMAEWLLECDPSEFPKAPGGTLTRELAWDTLLTQRLGLTNECYDPIQLLLTLTQLKEPGQTPVGLRERAQEWLASRGGPALGQLLELYFRVGARDTLALCLVFEVVFLAPPGPEALMAQGSLDRFLDGRRLPAGLGQRLGQYFRELVRLETERLWLGPVQTRAREFLGQLNAEALAQHSLMLPEGWDALLAQAGQALLLGQDPPDLSEHLLCEERSQDLLPLAMAQRLQRFLAQPSGLPGPGLASWMDHYLDEVAWLDRTRLWLQPPHAQLGGAFQQLLARVLPWREAYNREFAQALARGQQDTLPVEHFLDEVLVPLVQEKGARLLLLVLDGCSQAALLDLLESLDQRNWSHYAPVEARKRRLLSALPSLTEVARTSLLCGQRMQGAAAQEVSHFRAHPGLKNACRKDYGPQLFHKKDMDQALLRTQQEDYKLVAVVINSIDDTLAREEQLKLRWTQDLIAPLEPLLQAARATQRAVLIVSDHGHVLDHGTVERPSVGAGNRWQPGGGPEEGALFLEGGRLQLAASARLLYSESVRYGPRKRGYHGGVSPQEMVCALALLAQPGQTLAGWVEGSRRPPAWWNQTSAAIALPQVEAELALFEHVLSERLFLCDALRHRDGRPPHLAEAIELLASKGRLEREALAQGLGMTRSQLQSLLPLWTRWLNVAGQAILRADYQAVWLDNGAVQAVLAR